MATEANDFTAKAIEAEEMAPPTRPTEAMVGPVALAIRRSWPYDKRPVDGHWYAALDVGPLRSVWSCNHDHDDPEEAWLCAARACSLLTVNSVDPNDYDWGA